MATIRLAWRSAFCPSKVRDGRSLPPRRCRRLGHLSWDRAALQSVVGSDVSSCRVTRSRRGVRRFRPALAVFRPLPSAMACAVASSSRALRLPSRVSRATTGPAGAGRLPWAFLPLRDFSLRSPLGAGVPVPLRSALGVSHALDGFLLRRPCGFVSPRCHVPGLLYRVFPSREAVRARHPPLPSCRWLGSPAIGVTRRRQETSLGSRTFLRSRIRCERWWVGPPPARYPPELPSA